VVGKLRVVHRFDNSPEAWLWKDLLDQRDEACIEAAIIEVLQEAVSGGRCGDRAAQGERSTYSRALVYRLNTSREKRT
jgi:hypothetical protein